jgi:tryptophan-rich sensory protein
MDASLLIPAAVAASVAIMVAVLGGLLTELGPWYHGLRKPSWQPPDWAFGPVWTVILAMAALAAALAWRDATDAVARGWILVVLIVNCVLHVLWSPLFFKLKRPDWAFVEVIFLWLSVLALVVVLGRHSAMAGLLLVPYIVWVTVAAKLNYDVVKLNGPFA